MQRELNAIYKPIGIKFVITKHVMDRVNNTDGREKTVSLEEIVVFRLNQRGCANRWRPLFLAFYQPLLSLSTIHSLLTTYHQNHDE